MSTVPPVCPSPRPEIIGTKPPQAAIAAGYADTVVVYRGLAQGQFGRFGQARPSNKAMGEGAYRAPYGLATAASQYAMIAKRWMHENGGRGAEAQKAVSLTSYAHAQSNPRRQRHSCIRPRKDSRIG